MIENCCLRVYLLAQAIELFDQAITCNLSEEVVEIILSLLELIPQIMSRSFKWQESIFILFLMTIWELRHSFRYPNQKDVK